MSDIVVNFRDPDVIFETEHWIVNLGWKQSYLGRSVVFAKENKEHLHELSLEQILDFHQNVVCRMELALQKAFGASLFNWLCLKNGGYKQFPPNPIMHWHLIPRYRDPVIFSSVTFTDFEFGRNFDREKAFGNKQEKENRSKDLTAEQRISIVREIRRYVSI